jgi:uncharacterized membrane protein YjfL (UPF0719 family)
MGQLFLSLLQLAIAIILSAFVAFLAVYLFQWFTRGMDEWEALRQRNPAVGIVLGAVTVAAAIVLRPALAVDTSTWDIGNARLFAALLSEALQLALGLVFTLVSLALSLAIFAALTRGIDEVQEIKSGNVAMATLLAGVTIGVALMVSHALAQIMSQISGALF